MNNKLKINFNKKKLKNWKFWFKFFFAWFIFSILIYCYIDGIRNIELIKEADKTKTWVTITNGKTIIDYAGYTDWTISFFTFQSNLLIAIWFLFGAIYHNQKNKIWILKPYTSIALTVYITLTCLVANLYLLPLGLISNNITNNDNSGTISGSILKQILIQETLHFLIPLVTIVYLCLFYEFEKKELKDYQDLFTKKTISISLYPMLYSIYALLRGELLYRSNKPYSVQYPYFFFYIHQNGGKNYHNPYPLKGINIDGISWFFITLVIFFIIILAFSILYLFALKKRAQKYK